MIENQGKPDIDNLLRKISNYVTDYDGSRIVRGAEPMPGFHCGVLYDAVDIIEALRNSENNLQENYTELLGRVTTLDFENCDLRFDLAEAERHNEALRDKVSSEDCGCAYDTPDDICMAHSPMVNDLKRKLAAAEAKNAELRSQAETARRNALNEALALICNYPDAYYRLDAHIRVLAEKT